MGQGYACPVCEAPQPDATHLANHLAFTALLRGGDHESWLDEHAPGWGESGAEALAARVVDHVEETEFDAVFEDTTGAEPHGHDHGHGPEHGTGQGPGDDRGDVPYPGMDPSAGRRRRDPSDAVTREVLAEARELTEQMRATGDAGDDDETDDDVDAGDAETDDDVDAADDDETDDAAVDDAETDDVDAADEAEGDFEAGDGPDGDEADGDDTGA